MAETVSCELPTSIFVMHNAPTRTVWGSRFEVRRGLRVYRDAGVLRVQAGWITRIGRDRWFSLGMPTIRGWHVELPPARLAVNSPVEADLFGDMFIAHHRRRYDENRIAMYRDAIRIKMNDGWTVYESTEIFDGTADVYTDLTPIGLGL